MHWGKLLQWWCDHGWPTLPHHLQVVWHYSTEVHLKDMLVERKWLLFKILLYLLSLFCVSENDYYAENIIFSYLELQS